MIHRSTAALYLMCVAIWGTTWLAITFQIDAAPPEAAVVHRFLLAALVLFAWCRWRGLRLRYDLRQHRALAAQGMLMLGVSYVFVYHAEMRVVSGLVAVGFSASPLINMLGARIAYGTPMTWRVTLGGTLGLIGIGVIFHPELAGLRSGGETLSGVLFTALAVVTSAAGSLIASRNQARGIAVRPALAWASLYGAAVTLAVALAGGKSLALPVQPGYVAALVYLALFGSVIAFSGYLLLLQRIGAARAGYIGVMVPIVALVVSALFEDYAWTPATWAGVALSLAGNLLVLRR